MRPRLLEDEVALPDMTARPLAAEPLVLIGSPGHPPAALGRPVTWEELARETFFLHEEGCSYSDRVARELLGVRDARPRLTRFDSSEAARTCVAAGLGLDILPAPPSAPPYARAPSPPCRGPTSPMCSSNSSAGADVGPPPRSRPSSTR